MPVERLLHKRSAGSILLLSSLALTLLPATLPGIMADSSCPASTPGFRGLDQPDVYPEELLALVEIPAGGQVKYELHPETGRMEVDRFLSMPMAYPVNYGILPCTLAEDGDAFDVLILTRAPLLPGSLIRVRPIGLLPMLDRGEQDDKVLVVPVDAVDPTWSDVRDVGDLPGVERERIRAFFRVYKELPDPNVEVQVEAWLGADDARDALRRAAGPERNPERG